MAMMKSSNTEWLGDIPAEWDVAQIGNYYELRNEKVSDYDFEPLSVTMKGIVPQLATAVKSDDHSNRKLVKKGDFVINSRSDRRGSCGISALDGSVSLINTVMEPRGEMNPQYYNWLFHTEQFADEFYKWGHGIVDDLWTTRWQEMKKILIVAPSPDEQQAIADYLDETCSKIDEIIAEAKASIDEYKELRIAIIDDFTICGFNKTKLKYISKKIGDGLHGTPQYSDNGTVAFINGTNIGDEKITIKSNTNFVSIDEAEKHKNELNSQTILISLNGTIGNSSLYDGENIILGKSA
ncbi:MAG: type I restriction endonuclease subunit S, partial [Firmicutes bacterium]|nr:type I restriction endonuclease subunit S [Bacillota bacterium]